MCKIVNLQGYKNKRNGNISSIKKDKDEYESFYDRALRKMTAEEYKMLEELLED